MTQKDRRQVDPVVADLSERMVGVEVGLKALKEKAKVESGYQQERNREIINSIESADARGQKRGMDLSAGLEKLHARLTDKKKSDDELRRSLGMRGLMFLGTVILALVSFIYLNDIGHGQQ